MNLEVERLLDLAAAMPPERRASFLDEACPDTHMRSEVESLLQYVTGAEQYFEDALQSVAASVGSSREPAPGDAFGAYRILSLLGRGGMGAVYLAERVDGELQQKVAIKLLRGDCFRPVWRERFLTERQLLASLQHPSIIHVIDAGHTAAGRPFLIMEYVDGQPIDTYAAELDIRGRLKLFLHVCDGVAHAHRRLIIHRDLKPSNILVDAGGQPKLLDFGIAKLLDDPGSTQTVEQMLTPAYASPEQVSGAAQTTATDIYSLGVILHQLLTGAAPLPSVPGKPKARLAPPSEFNPQVPRDVDFIVRKALRPEPEDRYLSVDEFAADIRAALDWRPVQARSGDRWYRARRFLRRYWMPLAASVAVVASLSTGLYIANRERLVAERRFIAVRQLANKLFEIDTQVAQLPGGSKTRQFIVDTALEYLQRMTADARDDASLALELGAAYMRVGRVLGVNISPNLGQTAQADQAAAKAEALIESVLAADPTNRTALLRAAQIAHDRMILAGDRHLDQDSLKFAGKSVALFERYFATGELTAKSDRREAQQVILSHTNIANRYMIAGYYDEAIKICARGREIARVTNWPTQAGAGLMIVALSQRAKGNLDQALAAIRESVSMLKPSPDETATGRFFTYSLALVREGQILGEADSLSFGRTDEAIDFLQQGMAIASDYAKRDPNDFTSHNRIFSVESRLARIVQSTDPRRAVELYDDALQRLARMAGHGSTASNEIRTLAASAVPLARLGRRDEARKRLDKAFARLAELNLYPAQQITLGSEADEALRAQAEFEAPERGAQIYSDLLQSLQPAVNLTDAVSLSNLYRDAAVVHRKAHQPADAARLEASRRDLWQQWDKALPNNPFIRRQL